MASPTYEFLEAESYKYGCQGTMFFSEQHWPFEVPSDRPPNHVTALDASFSYLWKLGQEAAWSPRWNGTPANWFPVKTCRTRTVAFQSARYEQHIKAGQAPSDGPGCHELTQSWSKGL